MNPRVSVVMPVLRPDPRFFREAIESIGAQTLRDWELIVVEAASEIAAAPLLPKDDRIRLITEQQPTAPVAQRNRGLREARAPLVAMLDADDVARPDRLEVQAAFFDAHPDLAVAGGQIEIIDEHGTPIAHRRYPLDHEQIVRAMARYNPLAHPSVRLRRDAVLAAGGYSYGEENTSEDYELWSRLARGGARFANLDRTLISYRVHLAATKAARLRALLRGTLHVKQTWWSDRQTLRGRARMLGERLLLQLPPPLVLRAFLLLEYGYLRLR